MFGFEKGAFTGALKTTLGKFEQANKGTLFLDEIGDMPFGVQTKLLRVLENSIISKVGSSKEVKLDVRIICATHKNLDFLVEDNSFREDLLFRLNTFEIRVPALREHMSDLLLLIKHFIEQKQQSVPEGIQLITDEAVEIMQTYDWPGNVRELANCIEHALVLCDELPILLEHLPLRIQGAEREAGYASTGSSPSGTNSSESVAHEKSEASKMPRSLKQMEMQAILDGLGRNNGNKVMLQNELSAHFI